MRIPAALVAVSSLSLAGCYATRFSSGGGQTEFNGAPEGDPSGADLVLPPGFRADVIATGLTFPTGVCFDAEGRPCVVESGYSYGEVWATPRLLRIGEGGAADVIAEGGRNGPWNGVAFADGSFYIAEGGALEGGRILRVAPDGAVTVLIENLPSLGDHHTNGPVVGPDGAVYFGQGTATNSGVVGADNAAFGWLERNPDFHDTPARDVILAGKNYTTDNPLTTDPDDRVETGAFLPFGTPSEPGQVVRGQVPCSGAIMKIPPGGGPVELVAWGLRNPYGLAFDPQDRLYVTENSFDVRGSRPVFGAGDQLWRIEPGAWYGWPDFHGGRPLSESDHFKAPGQPAPGFLLASVPTVPRAPDALLGVHACATGLDFSRSEGFGYVGDAFIALFGDMAPATGKVLGPVGYRVVRVEVQTGVVEDFALNRRGRVTGPASLVGGTGLERPVACRFSPEGDALYVVDFGVMTVTDKGPEPRPKTGVLWRITRP